ncbi:MAG: hypothetical protein Q4A01_00365 [Coriobacteriales bacterium]|nr:hypothetical protein [Coriobacteriales bacterium]
MQVERRDYIPASERAQALAEGQRVGTLSAMTADERTRAIREHLDSKELAPMRNSALVAAALTHSMHAKPVRSMTQLLNKIPVDDLRMAVRGFGPQGEIISALRKKEIVSFIAQTITSADVGYMDLICARGTRFANGVRRILEAGGSIQVRFDDLQSTDQLLMPVFPIVFLTNSQDTFANIVPSEICALLADADWDEAARRAARMDEAVHYFDLMVDFCGIVSFDEAYDAYRAQATDPLPYQILEYAFAAGTIGEVTGFEPTQIDDELCLVHSDLLYPFNENDEDEFDEFGDLFDMGMEELAALRDAQGEFEPRPLSKDMLEDENVVSWVARNDVAQELMAFLDGHMSNDTNEYLAADVLLHALVRNVQQGGRLTSAVLLLKEGGFVLGKDQLDYAVGLCAAVAAHVPCWENNGWTSLEVLSGKATQAYDPDWEADVIPFGPRDTTDSELDISEDQDLAEIFQLDFDDLDDYDY